VAVFKNITEQRWDIPGLDLRIEGGATFEVPDEIAHSFENQDWCAGSRVKNPDVTPDPALVEQTLTGPVPLPPAA